MCLFSTADFGLTSSCRDCSEAKLRGAKKTFVSLTSCTTDYCEVCHCRQPLGWSRDGLPIPCCLSQFCLIQQDTTEWVACTTEIDFSQLGRLGSPGIKELTDLVPGEKAFLSYVLIWWGERLPNHSHNLFLTSDHLSWTNNPRSPEADAVPDISSSGQ